MAVCFVPAAHPGLALDTSRRVAPGTPHACARARRVPQPSPLARLSCRLLCLLNLTWFGAEAACALHERLVSGAPHVPKGKAEVARVTPHRSGVRLETAKPRTAQSRCAPLRAFLDQGQTAQKNWEKLRAAARLSSVGKEKIPVQMSPVSSRSDVPFGHGRTALPVPP